MSVAMRATFRRTTARRCHGGQHVKQCRPGRPLCREMRRVQATKYASCNCGAVHFPHRKSYCTRGGAARYGYGWGPQQPAEDVDAQAEAAFEEACAFFEELAVSPRKAG